MINALFAYEDVAAAQRAAQRVGAQLSPQAVMLHAKNVNGRWVEKADEAVISGGLLSTLYDLFQGIFEWSESPHDASHYEETVRRGGGVVSVNVQTPDEQARVDQAMQGTGFDQRTDWSVLPDGSD